MNSPTDMFKYIQNMPKVELHAHLSGSISTKTLEKLFKLKKSTDSSVMEDELIVPKFKGELSQFFDLFTVINKVTDSFQSIFMTTEDVIQEFYDDGVRYLELRTTPKENNNGLTKQVYIDAVLQAIAFACNNECPGMIVKLLISIDRKKSLKDAETTLQAVEQFMASGEKNIVGIDLSGDPTKGDVKDFLPLLNHAKYLGLKLALHVAEVPGSPKEVRQLLELYPQRLGHGTFLHPDKNGSLENFQLLKELRIPLEICLTSNILCKTVPSYEDHHFKLFKEMGYPCALCTDDKGIYGTTLSEEYNLAAKHYSLSKSSLFDLSFESIDYAFCSESEKDQLRKEWKLFLKTFS